MRHQRQGRWPASSAGSSSLAAGTRSCCAPTSFAVTAPWPGAKPTASTAPSASPATALGRRHGRRPGRGGAARLGAVRTISPTGLAHAGRLEPGAPVMAKAGALTQRPRFIVTSLPASAIDARTLYKDIYCARGKIRTRCRSSSSICSPITSAATMRANQLRLSLASFALRAARSAPGGRSAPHPVDRATCGTMRLKLLKIGAQVRRGRTWIKIAMAWPAYQRPPGLSLPEAHPPPSEHAAYRNPRAASAPAARPEVRRSGRARRAPRRASPAHDAHRCRGWNPGWAATATVSKWNAKWLAQDRRCRRLAVDRRPLGLAHWSQRPGSASRRRSVRRHRLPARARVLVAPIRPLAMMTSSCVGPRLEARSLVHVLRPVGKSFHDHSSEREEAVIVIAVRLRGFTDGGCRTARTRAAWFGVTRSSFSVALYDLIMRLIGVDPCRPPPRIHRWRSASSVVASHTLPSSESPSRRITYFGRLVLQRILNFVAPPPDSQTVGFDSLHSSQVAARSKKPCFRASPALHQPQFLARWPRSPSASRSTCAPAMRTLSIAALRSLIAATKAEGRTRPSLLSSAINIYRRRTITRNRRSRDHCWSTRRPVP